MGSVQVNCAYCGEVIGVYEPMIAVVKGQVCETSLAAKAAAAEVAGALLYHRVCYERTVD